MKGHFAGAFIFAGGMAAGLVLGSLYGSAIQKNTQQ